ncbi:MAG: hypothetical protein H6557_24580 [Lewinellaceae bacterium]|nr:hypothetical protein [Phaeodactylibacter sp.]MCB9039808.1 hypothetical protein [Lewinellaceae bacterium]
MYPYKVEYIYASSEKRKWYQSKGPVDAWTLAKELEALLVESHSKGYELANITPILTHEMVQASYPATRTDGLMVTFRKAETME